MPTTFFFKKKNKIKNQKPIARVIVMHQREGSSLCSAEYWDDVLNQMQDYLNSYDDPNELDDEEER